MEVNFQQNETGDNNSYGKDTETTNINSQNKKKIQTQEEKQFRRQHQEYIAQKKARKLELIRQRKARFGQSSSSQDDGCQKSESSKEQQNNKIVISVGKISIKQQKQQNQKVINNNNQKYSIYLQSKKTSLWVDQNISFIDNNLVLMSCTYNFKDIKKVKSFNSKATQDTLKLKISYKSSQEIMLGASSKLFIGDVPLHYFLFAKIITQKLKSLGITGKQTITPSIPGVPEQIILNSLIYGRIYKKSQMLGKWQQRFIVINKDGIYSYKKFNDKHSMFIANLSIKQIWTRFQIIDNLLVVKIQYDGATKTQLGIPLTDFLSRKVKNNWLFHLYCKSIRVL